MYVFLAGGAGAGAEAGDPPSSYDPTMLQLRQLKLQLAHPQAEKSLWLGDYNCDWGEEVADQLGPTIAVGTQQKNRAKSKY